MKRIFAIEGKPVVLDVPEPELRTGEVLVQTAYSAVSSGTELKIIDTSANPETLGEDTYPNPRGGRRAQLRKRGVDWGFPEPRSQRPGTASLGYSLSGTVIAVSKEITDLQIGDHVACSGNQCAVHAERVAVPRNLVAKVPHGLPLEKAAFVTLGCSAMTGIRRAECAFGETIVVYGLGLLGLLGTQIARSAGLYVLGLDIDDRRIEQALRAGATRAINPTRDDAVRAVLDMTDGFGADAVVLLIATKSSDPLNLAFDLCRSRARVVGVGAFGMNITRGRMYAREVTLVPSIAYGAGRYDTAYEEGGIDFNVGYTRWTENRQQQLFLRLVAEGKVMLDGLATAHVPIGSAPEGYDLLRSPDRPATVLFTYGTP
jgi:threonine dehydrogenase-like Zn-dependent dehydrogenase